MGTLYTIGHEKPLPPFYNDNELEALKYLKKFFGYDSFKDGQYRAIVSILNRRDTLAVMPTGAGKSICYQIPALMMQGVTIVVSPLIALMQDQVNSLRDELLDKLKQIRTNLARESGLPPYIVFTDKTLIEMCIHLPITEAEFLQISGVGENKLEKYGGVFIPVIREFAENQPVTNIITSEETKKDDPDSAYKRPTGVKPPAAGSPWTKEEDTLLRSEYESGLKISEIAKNHSRTYGAIRARLKKFGLIE